MYRLFGWTKVFKDRLIIAVTVKQNMDTLDSITFMKK